VSDLRIANLATLRAVARGTNRPTPNSTDFSTSHRCLSPFGRGAPRVRWGEDSRSTSARERMARWTSVRVIRSTWAENSMPEPSKRITLLPGDALMTWVR